MTSLAIVTAELRDAAADFDWKMEHWSRYTPEEVGAAAVRLYHAKRALRDFVTEPVGVA